MVLMPRYTLNIDDERYEQIKQAASEDRRTIGAELHWLIDLGLAARKENNE